MGGKLHFPALEDWCVSWFAYIHPVAFAVVAVVICDKTCPSSTHHLLHSTENTLNVEEGTMAENQEKTLNMNTFWYIIVPILILVILFLFIFMIFKIPDAVIGASSPATIIASSYRA